MNYHAVINPLKKARPTVQPQLIEPPMKTSINPAKVVGPDFAAVVCPVPVGLFAAVVADAPHKDAVELPSERAILVEP